MNLKSIAFSLLLCCLFVSSLRAQTISGRVLGSDKKALPYASITIFQQDKAVASVITDEQGRFKLALDSGWHRFEVQYVGHVKENLRIQVQKDEVLTFQLKAGKQSLAVNTRMGSGRSGEKDGILDAAPVEELESISVMSRGRSKSRGAIDRKREAAAPAYKDLKRVDSRASEVNPAAGLLTAGEINDFSKWELWKDLSEGELKQYQAEWNMAIGQRYTVQLMTAEGFPMSDVQVSLVDRAGKQRWTSRTDNTGKAELWSGLNEVQTTAVASGLRIKVHGKNGERWINAPMIAEKGVNSLKLTQSCDPQMMVDISFIVDATGSMGDEIEFLKSELSELIFQAKSSSPELFMRFSSVFYRDHSDEYLTRHLDFTEVLSETQQFISAQHAGGGGDYPEAVEEALAVAIDSLSWSKKARARIAFLILDAPPHNNPEIQQKLRDLSLRASQQGIRIVPLVASGINKSAEYLLRNIALATNGTYVFLTDDSGIGGHHIKPSTDTFSVESLNALMIRLVKQFTYQPNCQQQLPEPLESQAAGDSVLLINDFTSHPDSSLYANNDSSHVLPPVGIKMSWKYYPNPTRDILHIEASGLTKEHLVYITDFSGKLLQTIRFSPGQLVKEVDMRSYAAGIYLLRYPLGEHWKSSKFILSH